MKKIDWAGAIQMIANVGVLASIVFLAIQLRQNNELLGIQTRGNALSRSVGTTDLVLENPYLLELLGKEVDTLTPSERDALIVLGMRNLSNFEIAYQDAIRGLLDEVALRRTVSAVWRRPTLNFGMPLAWPTFKGRGDPEFVAWMERHVIAGQ